MKEIYADNTVCKWHITRVGFQPTEDITAKIALYQVPFPYDQGHGEKFESKIDQSLIHSEYIIVLCSELHEKTANFIRRYQNPKIKFFLCGTVEGVDSSDLMDWFITSTHFYKKNSHILNQLTPYQSKPKFFDILLGQRKLHRNIIYDFINNNRLTDQVIMTYLKGDNSIPLIKQDSQGWIWEDVGLELPKHEFTWTVTPIRYHDQGMSLSQVIPIGIYNQTAYSVVAETNYDNHYSFYTEKIVKPILAERLFVVFSGQHYLRNLRSRGFRTFDGIIDETYDTIEDNNLRFKLAYEQIQYLINQSQENILTKIRSITEYNKKVMIETDWFDNFSKELRAVLLDHTN
jgi:hypothetical protein